MAGQWVGAPADEGTQHADVPVQRRASGRQATGGRAEARRAEGRRADNRRAPQPSRSAAGTSVLLALGLPLVGALLDELRGSGPGLIFAVLTVLGTAGAALLAGRAGWWWVLPAPPPVVLAATAATEMLANSSKYQGSKALATGAAKWAIHGFPVMVAAMAAALVVIVVRVARDRRSRRG